jgi:hypothetical protein
MKKKFKHTELNKKRSHPKVGPLASDEKARDAVKIQSDDEWKSILQLCDEYEVRIDDDLWMNLALALARDFVPAFQERKRPGPKTKWNSYRCGILVVEIERLVESHALSIEAAADLLATMRPWKQNIQVKDKMVASSDDLEGVTPDAGEALRHIYFLSRDKKWTDVTRLAYKWHKDSGTLSDWDEAVSSVFEA